MNDEVGTLLGGSALSIPVITTNKRLLLEPDIVGYGFEEPMNLTGCFGVLRRISQEYLHFALRPFSPTNIGEARHYRKAWQELLRSYPYSPLSVEE